MTQTKAGLAIAAAGGLMLLLSPVLTYASAHRKAEAFLTAHPEIRWGSFDALDLGSDFSRDYRYLITDGGQPVHGHYVLEFDNLGVLETSQNSAQPKVLSSGYLDFTAVPGWLYICSLVLFCGGSVLVALVPRGNGEGNGGGNQDKETETVLDSTPWGEPLA